MYITKVKVSELFSIAGYNNISFGYEAEVSDGEDVEDVKKNLLKRIDDDFLNFCTQKNIKVEKFDKKFDKKFGIFGNDYD